MKKNQNNAADNDAIDLETLEKEINQIDNTNDKEECCECESDLESSIPNDDSKEKMGKDQSCSEEEESDTEKKIETLENNIKEHKDRYLRLMAEFDNYKRRTSKEYERLIEMANERLILELIEVRENFERALSMTDSNGGGNIITITDGMKLIYNKFDSILKKNGLTAFTEIGDLFDPQIHDAMMKAPDNNIEQDHICAIYEKGYKLKDRVIRHAKVIISSGASENTEQNESSPGGEKTEIIGVDELRMNETGSDNKEV